MSPTARSMHYLRERGYHVEIVERFIPGACIRKDMFGFIDLLGFKDGEIVGVQSTSDSNVAARVNKITDSEYLPMVRRHAWRIVVHGWRKGTKGRWQVREVDLS